MCAFCKQGHAKVPDTPRMNAKLPRKLEFGGLHTWVYLLLFTIYRCLLNISTIKADEIREGISEV